MPSLTLSGQQITPKTLQRSIDRSRKIVGWHTATYHAEVLPRLRKLALRCYRDAMQATGDDCIKLARAFAELNEMRRSLLGFPSPGRRKDESAGGSASARATPSIIDVAEAAAQSGAAQRVDASESVSTPKAKSAELQSQAGPSSAVDSPS